MSGLLQSILRSGGVLLGALGLTLVFFLVLPLIQAIHQPPKADTVLQSLDTAEVPPPPPPPEKEPEKKEEQEEKPPELEQDQPQPLDLNALSRALNPGMGDGWGFAGASLNLKGMVDKGLDLDSVASLSDLDQEPRVVYQPGPIFSAQVRKKAPGTVYVLFEVDRDGKVQDAKVQSSTDPVFERPALAAVKRWKFEPGKREGKPVRFRMRVPITFPKG